MHSTGLVSSINNAFKMLQMFYNFPLLDMVRDSTMALRSNGP